MMMEVVVVVTTATLHLISKQLVYRTKDLPPLKRCLRGVLNDGKMLLSEK